MIVILLFLYMDGKLHLDLDVLFSHQGNCFVYTKEEGHKSHQCNSFIELMYLLSNKLRFILSFLLLVHFYQTGCPCPLC